MKYLLDKLKNCPIEYLDVSDNYLDKNCMEVIVEIL